VFGEGGGRAGRVGKERGLAGLGLGLEIGRGRREGGLLALVVEAVILTEKFDEELAEAGSGCPSVGRQMGSGREFDPSTSTACLWTDEEAEEVGTLRGRTGVGRARVNEPGWISP
jgi:hypothetical protein